MMFFSRQTANPQETNPPFFRAGAMTLLCLSTLIGLGACRKPTSYANSNGPILIGASIPLSGPLAAFGMFMKWGYQHAVEEANAQGGIAIDGKKRPVQLIILDDATNPNTTASNIEVLVLRDHAIALLGSCTPQLANAGGLAAERLHIPMVTGCTPVQAFLDVKQWQWVWDLFFDESQLAALPFQALQDSGVKTNRRVALIHDNGPDGGKVGGTLWPQYAAQNGYQVVANASFPIDTTNFESAIQEAKNSAADIAMIDTGTAQAVSIRRQIAAAGYAPKILVSEKGGEPVQFAQALGKLADAVLVGGYWDPSLPYPGAAQLGEDFQKQTGQMYSQHIADSYTAAKVLLDALTRAGSTGAQKINNEVGRTSGTYPVGKVEFQSDHAARLGLVELQWQSGATKIVWPKLYANAPLLFPVPTSGRE